MRTITMISLLLTLTACATEDRHIWYAKYMTMEQAERARYECLRDARVTSQGYYVPPTSRFGILAIPGIQYGSDEELFRACMFSKGFEWRKVN